MAIGSGIHCYRGHLLLLSPSSIPRHCCLHLRAPFPSSFSFPVHLSSPVRGRRSPRSLRCFSRAISRRGGEPRSGFSSSCDLDGGEGSGKDDFLVVNFYKFVFIEDPQAEVSNHLSFLQGRDIHGRIYVNEQGINAQYSGPENDAMSYVDWLKEDPRFSDILVQTSPALSGHAFPRLKLRYKPSLVQLEGGISHLPLLKPTMRATPLTPSEWRERLQARSNIDKPSHETDSSVSNRKFLLLDVRNGYEWDIGHFQGAERPNVDCFRTTSFGLSEQEIDTSDPLIGIDKEKTDILMYCTGGIRCDVYSTILRQKGFHNLYTLRGGVSNYLKSEGPTAWVGNLFVFDSRLSLPPSTYKPGEDAEESAQRISERSLLARCYVCESQLLDFRHRNCANIDCNRLYLSCSSCVKELRGCCCSDCTNAPRLRPVITGHQRYHKWHIYRDSGLCQRSSNL
ncbi:rhodanese-like domain-containing protein 8, chloroplastic [Typha latifolia]|uniref:rhodanese-like domain-containing protein 8, chloroplastic n=1 Tax=Typha latifolia TaxID=4733 RepID=UPI003C2EF3F3